jgi:hypothetical protein
VTARFACPIALAVALLAPACGGDSDDYTPVREERTTRAAPSREAPPRLFARDSFWNAPLPGDARLDPRSDALVAELRRVVREELAAKRGPWLGTHRSSTPIYEVPRSQPTRRVALERPREPGRGALARAFRRVPIPDDARPARGRDAHLVVWQPSTDRMWEFFGMRRREGGGWFARWGGAMRGVSRNPGYYTRAAWPGAQSFWGASGTSLPIAGGVIRVDELRRRRIDHALALNLPEARAGVFSWPAQRSDGEDPRRAAIPEGARFRLDPDLDLDRMPLPLELVPIAEAAQRHGLVVRDRSSTVALYAEDPRGERGDPYAEVLAPWYPKRLHALLAHFPWERLQALELHPCTSRSLRAQLRERRPGRTGTCRPQER